MSHANDICTEERFLRDVRDHVMEVVRDDGVSRHVRFKVPGTYCMHFDLITWPGYLCYTGDMGSYVFRRLEDMFEFFRTDRTHGSLRDGKTLAINPGYWGEKLEAVDRHDGFKAFSLDAFKTRVQERLAEFSESLSEEDKAALLEEVEEQVLGVDDEHEAIAAIRGFETGRRVFNALFDDFWECSCMEYSYRFIWCCYALAWGIQKYDEAKGGAA